MLPMADGLVVVVQHDGSTVVLRERSLQAKLDLLFSKHLYVAALSLAQTEQVHAQQHSTCSGEQYTQPMLSSCHVVHHAGGERVVSWSSQKLH